MPEVKGFHGLRFNTEKVKDLSHVVTPPYDVITSMERRDLAERSPHNMVHLILPELEEEGKSRYASAAEKLEQWIEQGVLEREQEPSLYLLRQRFTDLKGITQVRRAFFAVVRIPEAEERSILGHEQTFDKPVEDRLRLTEATQANLGPVFLLYQDAGARIAKLLEEMDARPADGTANTLDHVQQEMWRIPFDPVVAEVLRNQTLYIADGHHRFRTAQLHRDAMREKHGGKAGSDALYEFVLAGFVAFDDPGLQIYPPHRVVQAPENFEAEDFLTELEHWFDIEPAEENLPELVASRQGGCAMGLCIHGAGSYLLTLRDIDRQELLGSDRGEAWRNLDVAVLHRGILEKILGIAPGTALEYEKNVDLAMRSVHSGAAGLAFILRAILPVQIRECAEAGEPMPQKSTYFFPKLPTGMVIHRLVE